MQKFPRESCKCRISLAGQQIKTFKSVNRNLKEPVVFKERVQESKDFHLLFLSQASISTRAWHTRVFNACQTGPKSSGHLKVQFSALEEGMLKLTFVHCFNLYVRTAAARRVISDFFFFYPSFRPISGYSKMLLYCTNSAFFSLPRQHIPVQRPTYKYTTSVLNSSHIPHASFLGLIAWTNANFIILS